MATFVLVHGGGHGGSCYRRTTPLLHAAGHDLMLTEPRRVADMLLQVVR